MGISDLAAPARRVALADQREAVAGAKGLHPLHEQVAECQRLAAQFAHVGLEQQVDARLERREPEHRRRAAEETLDPRRRIIIFLERKGPRVAEPAQIGRASCRERVCQYVSISGVAVSLKQKKKTRGYKQTTQVIRKQ